MANRQERRSGEAATKGLVARADGKVADDVPVSLFEVPAFYASGMQIAPIASEAILTFNRAEVGQAKIGAETVNVVRFSPLISVTVNVATLKQMLRAVRSVVEDYEKENGEIVIPAMPGEKSVA